MDIQVISTIENAKQYLHSARSSQIDLNELWQIHMIEPFWADLAKWAPFDISYMQPQYIRDLEALKGQIALLSDFLLSDMTILPMDYLHKKFVNIAKALPIEDDDTMLVAIYPLCDSSKIVKVRQNGVVGACVFGNIIINVNPLADDWHKWIPFVFVHEYHHKVWGHNWYTVRGGVGLEGTLLEYLINEGQADLFAQSLFPDLTLGWNRPFDSENEKVLWKRIKPNLFSIDREVHRLYMFGDESDSLPWCLGYSFGSAIVRDYMQNHPGITFLDLIDVPAREVFEVSRFNFSS